MNLCGTCKHWGDKTDEGRTFRVCRGLIHDEEEFVDKDHDADKMRRWAEQEEIQGVDNFRAAHKAVTQDGSGYRAQLKSRNDFGCVLHEVT